MTRFVHLTDIHVSHPDAGDPSANVAGNAAMLEQVGSSTPWTASPISSWPAAI